MTENKHPSTRRPKDAATLILIRRDGDRPEILMGQRHGRHAFMPNRYVFPGGGVDRTDHRVKAATPLREDVAMVLGRNCPPSRVRAIANAAIRETYEETGLMLAAPFNGERLGARAAPWPDFVARGVAPAHGALDYIFRAVTPPGRPRRFNARFFLAEADHLIGEIRPSEELGDIRWVSLDEALGLPIPRITHEVLDVVKKLGGCTPPGRRRTVPTFRMRHGRELYTDE